MLAIISAFIIGVAAILFGAAAHDNKLKGAAGSSVGMAISFGLLILCILAARYL